MWDRIQEVHFCLCLFCQFSQGYHECKRTLNPINPRAFARNVTYAQRSIYPSARELGAYAERAPSNPVDIPLANPMLAKPNYIFNSHPVPFRSKVFIQSRKDPNLGNSPLSTSPPPPPTTRAPPSQPECFRLYTLLPTLLTVYIMIPEPSPGFTPSHPSTQGAKYPSRMYFAPNFRNYSCGT